MGELPNIQEAHLMCIANRRIVDRFRYHRSRRADPSDSLDELLTDGIGRADDPVSWVEHRVTMERLWQMASRHLTLTEHRVAFMTWAMGKDDACIARILGIRTEATVRSRRSRAIAKIREHVGKNVVFSGASAPDLIAPVHGSS